MSHWFKPNSDVNSWEEFLPTVTKPYDQNVLTDDTILYGILLGAQVWGKGEHMEVEKPLGRRHIEAA